MKFTKKQKQTIIDFFKQEFGIDLFDDDVDNIVYVIKTSNVNWHNCKYCGMFTNSPDSLCIRKP